MPDTPDPDVRGVTIAPRGRIWPPLIILWFIWGSTYLGIALVGESMPPYLSMGVRFTAAAALLGAVLVITKGPRVLRVPRREALASSLMGAVLLGVVIGNLAQAERHVPSGVAALIIAALPLWIVVLRRLSGERPHRLTIIGVVIGLAGLAAMLIPGGTASVGGAGDTEVALWSAVIVVGMLVWGWVSWRSSGWPLPANALVTTFYEMAGGGLCGLAIGAVLGERFDLSAHYPPAAWAGLAWLIIASIVSYAAYMWLIQNEPMSLVSTYAYVNPVVAVILGFLVIGEPITPDVVLGLTVVLGGVLLVLRGERPGT